VMRCCTNILAATAVALVLITQTTPASADAIPLNGVLTFPSGLSAADPNATTPQVVLPLANPGAIVPATDNADGNPLKIDTAKSTGFDPTGVVDLLSKDNKQFGLSFFGTGIAPGGKLAFTLNVDKALSALPIFQQVAGIDNTLAAIPPPTTTVGSGSAGGGGGTGATDGGTSVVSAPVPPAPQTPEPISLLLWSVLGGIGLWQARRRRRTPVLPA
jgi:hypothetical protein